MRVEKTLIVFFFFDVPVPVAVIDQKRLGTLRSEDGDRRENVAEKENSHSFNLHCDYSKSLTLSNVGQPSKS